jgi:hypothetical protein
MAGVEPDSLVPDGRRSNISLPIEVSAITVILAIALGVLAGGGAALYQRSRPANYISEGVLLIDQPAVVAGAPDAGPLQKLQLLRLQYSSLLKTETIAGPVSRQVHLPIGEVEGALAGLVDPTTFTIGVAATTKSPSKSNLLAQAATAQLASYVAKSQARLGISPQARVVLDEVTTPRAGVRISVSTTKVLLPAIIAFIVVAGAFLVIADLLRRRQ